MLLLHLGFDGLPNVLEYHSLYQGWARGPRRALVAKKIIRAQRHDSIWAGTRGHRVRGQVHLLRPPA